MRIVVGKAKKKTSLTSKLRVIQRQKSRARGDSDKFAALQKEEDELKAKMKQNKGQKKTNSLRLKRIPPTTATTAPTTPAAPSTTAATTPSAPTTTEDMQAKLYTELLTKLKSDIVDAEDSWAQGLVADPHLRANGLLKRIGSRFETFFGEQRDSDSS